MKRGYSYERGTKIDNIRFLYRMTTIIRKQNINALTFVLH